MGNGRQNDKFSDPKNRGGILLYCAGAGGNTCGRKSRGDEKQLINLEWPNNASWGGVLASTSSTIAIEASEFHDNNASWGGVLASTSSTVAIEASEFHDNNASWGGVLASTSSTVTIEASEFHYNSARRGGVLHSRWRSTIIIEASEFHDNNASLGGVLASTSSTVTIEASEFHYNSARRGGVLHSRWRSTIIIEASEFHDNNASLGGVLRASPSSTIAIEASEFHDNNASWGGVLASINSTIAIEASEFHDNNASLGGVLTSTSSTIAIEASEFHDNNASLGGVLDSTTSSTVTIEASEFHSNSAKGGGVLDSINSTIAIKASEFHNNSARGGGGGVLLSTSSNIKIAGSNFTNNVSPIGAIIYATSRSMIQHNSFLLIDSNMAHTYGMIYLSDSEFIGNNSGNATFSNNLGSLMAFNSNITFTGYATFVNNTPSQTVSGYFQEGGAITLLQSNIFFDGECNLQHNHAENGGAIHSTESRLYVNGDVTIAHNTATGNGGGVYLSTSELNCQQKSTFVLWDNTASYKGGGLHAISSSVRAASSSSGFPQNVLYNINQRQYVYTGARINITGNAAERGGGLSLEINTKLYILKYDNNYNDDDNDFNTTTFTANSADYGGAIHVDDDTNSGTCASNTEAECFFQVLALYIKGPRSIYMIQSMHFSQNHANISGSTLYGGLLDRCAVSPFAELHIKYPHARAFKGRGDGIAYIKNVSTPTYFTHRDRREIVIDTNLSISSDPVRVCLCFNADQNNECTHQHDTEVKKGQTFTLSVIAIDQVGQPVSATIQTSLHFTESGLAEGQLIRKIPAECTNLTFNIVSPHKSENLSLYASDGPCKDAELSSAAVQIHFRSCSCPIGLQVSGMNSTNCTCDCHSDISEYMEHCDSHTGLLTKQPQTRA